MAKRKDKILKVGFDMDGVLLYNPARIMRPIIVFFKKIFLPKEQNKFHLPKSGWQKFIWVLLHRSSIIIAPGYEEVRTLVEQKKIKAYIVSARYEALKSDFYNWLKKLKADEYFTECFYNNNDEQPHLFKAKILKKLNLDIFVEDNWDIVNHLSKETDSKIFWIYNILDRHIQHNYKFPTLRKVLKHLKSISG